MRLCWKMLLPVITMSLLLNPLASAIGTYHLKNVLLPYADRPDLPDHHMFEQSLRLSLTAGVATCLDLYHEFIDVSSFPGRAPRCVKHIVKHL
jgi:hypothetical protein